MTIMFYLKKRNVVNSKKEKRRLAIVSKYILPDVGGTVW
jgi:hypothetical protein